MNVVESHFEALARQAGRGTTTTGGHVNRLDGRPLPTAPADPALIARIAAELGTEGIDAYALAGDLATRIQSTGLQQLARTIVSERQAERDQHLSAIVPVRADIFVTQIDDPVRPLLGTLMSEGHNLVLTARFKVGKTKVAENAVSSLITGRQFLGRFTATRPRRVVLLNYELTEADQRDRLRHLGIEPPDLALLHLVNLRGRRLVITSPTGRDHLAQILANVSADVLVVDTLGAALSDCSLDENVNTDVRRFLSAIDEIKLLAGTRSAIITAHTGRAQQDEGAEHARGATVVDDWADVRLVLTKGDDGTRFLYSEGRAVDLPESRLSFDEDSGRLSLPTGDVGLSRRLNKADGLVDLVVSLVAHNPGSSKRQLEKLLRDEGIDEGNGRNATREAIGLAERRGAIHHHKGDRNSHSLYLGAVHHQDHPCPAAPS